MVQARQSGMRGASSQRRWVPAGPAGLISLLMAIAMTPAAQAEESKYQRVRREHPALFKVYYDEIVMAYCGLVTPEAEAGFRLERDELLAADPLDEEAHRTVRVASDMAVDYAYQDHGLSGQKRWCGTEGRDAYNRFIGRYRAQPADPGAETE
jgi:hypothetical protein